MNNKPAGYFKKNYDNDWIECEAPWEKDAIPLYTHPSKDLTDEEIDLTGKNNEGVLRLFYMIKGDVTGLQFKEALRDFARAILRKAQEK
jgi:hypothetical protein